MSSLVLLILAVLVISIAYLLLRPDPLAKYDLPEGRLFESTADSGSNSSAALKLVHEKITAAHSQNIGLS